MTESETEPEQTVFDYNHAYNSIIRCYEGDVYLAKENGIYRIPGGDGEEELLYENTYGAVRGMELYQDFLYFCGSLPDKEERRATIYRMSLDTFEVQDLLENQEQTYELLAHVSIYEDKLYAANYSTFSENHSSYGFGQRIGFALNQNGEVVRQLDENANDFLYREYNDYEDLEAQKWTVTYDTEEYWNLVAEQKEKYLPVMDVAACKKLLHGNHVVSRYKDELLGSFFLETEEGAYEYLCDATGQPFIVTETGIYYAADDMGNIWYTDFATKTPRSFYENDTTQICYVNLANYDADYVYLLIRYSGFKEAENLEWQQKLVRVPRNGGAPEEIYRFEDEWNNASTNELTKNCGVYNGRMYFAGYDTIDLNPDSRQTYDDARQ